MTGLHGPGDHRFELFAVAVVDLLASSDQCSTPDTHGTAQRMLPGDSAQLPIARSKARYLGNKSGSIQSRTGEGLGFNDTAVSPGWPQLRVV